MKIKKIILAAAAAAFLCSCGKKSPAPPAEISSPEPLTQYIQQPEHLYLDEASPTGIRLYTPLNYSEQIGIWFPYMHYDEYMQGKTADEFRTAVREKYSAAKSDGINTIYVHVHPCGDAYYTSEIFPRGTYLSGDFDPLEIMLEEGHALALSVHAWINPLRCQTAEQLNDLPDSFIVKKWANTKGCDNVKLVNGRYYLNPACDEALQLINDSVTELALNYDIDGIHIDDYFYPTTDKDFDSAQFKKSGCAELSAFRLEQCSKMVHGIYESVKRADDRLLFGISPQGNINADYSSQYADVRLWGSCIGYCDYLVPQIYFGFKNNTCPFEQTLREWEELTTCENVSLVIGLAAYKQGSKDKWAGAAGELEWAEDDTVIQRQIDMVTASEKSSGYALYY